MGSIDATSGGPPWLRDPRSEIRTSFQPTNPTNQAETRQPRSFPQRCPSGPTACVPLYRSSNCPTSTLIQASVTSAPFLPRLCVVCRCHPLHIDKSSFVAAGKTWHMMSKTSPFIVNHIARSHLRSPAMCLKHHSYNPPKWWPRRIASTPQSGIEPIMLNDWVVHVYVHCISKLSCPYKAKSDFKRYDVRCHEFRIALSLICTVP